MNLKKLQTAIALQQPPVNGWLFCDFHNREHIAYRVLGLDIEKHLSRRWFYYVPQSGSPIKLCHGIEPAALDALPGRKELYAGHEQLWSKLSSILRGVKTVAMQYSPNNEIPTVSLVDAGTIEKVRSFGIKVVSSADLVQRLYSVLDEHAFESHVRAGAKVQAIKDHAFQLIFSSIQQRKKITEYDVAGFIRERFDAAGLTNENHGPIVAANAHAADPHFEPTDFNSVVFKKGDRILIDLWAKEKVPGAVYYDITWCGFAGPRAPEKYARIFKLALYARDAAVDTVRKAFSSNKDLYGWQVDQACRAVIEKAGLGKHFIHRTGHSIDTSVHGEGANMDGLETKDNRRVLPGALFSVEPGIYLSGANAIGLRTEINVFVHPDNKVEIVGPVQKELLCME
jgi:Xaa-Pro aminopeptidase